MGLRIFPTLVKFDVADCCLVNSKLLCEIFSGDSSFKRGADSRDRVIWDFCSVVILANNVLTTFKRVFGVFAFSTRYKVGGIDALGVVA